MILKTRATDVFLTASIDGAPANWLTPSLLAAGIDLDVLRTTLPGKIVAAQENKKRWKDIYTAGHGVGNIEDIPAAADLCRRLIAQYREAKSEMARALGRNRRGVDWGGFPALGFPLPEVGRKMREDKGSGLLRGRQEPRDRDRSTSKGRSSARCWSRSRRRASATPTSSHAPAAIPRACFPVIFGHEGAGVVVDVGPGHRVAEEGRPRDPALHARMPPMQIAASPARPTSAPRSARPRARA